MCRKRRRILTEITQKIREFQRSLKGNKQAANAPLSFEVSGGGFQYLSQNQTSAFNQKKKANSNLSNYITVSKRNSSLEEYNAKTNIIGVKLNKGMSQEMKNPPESTKNKLTNWEENGSTSPTHTRTNLTKDKLKKLTNHLGTGASRNSEGKGMLYTAGMPKGYKKNGCISPKYMTQGFGSYYLKGK